MADLAGLIAKQGSDLRLRQAIVTAIAANGTCTIRFGDLASTTTADDIAGVHMLSSAFVLSGNTVWVLQTGGTLVIVGTVSAATPGAVPPPRIAGWSRFSMGPTSTASTTFVDVPGWTDLAFTKLHTPTELFFTLHAGGYATGNTGGGDFGLRVNGVDVAVCHFFFNEVNTHRHFSASIGGFGGLAAGGYVARLRWSTTAGALNIDGNDLFSLRIEELL